MTENDNEKDTLRAGLYLVATPIGNLGDMSHRAIEVLAGADALACEDTRHTRILLQHYDIPKPATVFSYHEHNEQQASRRIAGLVRDGLVVALCTNAGTPSVSDPGFRAVDAVLAEGGEVISVPGANAVLTALSVSGLPVASFTFKGFAPRKPGKRGSFIAMEKDSPHTLIFYEAPNRLGEFLQAALEELGDRRAAVCLELTKMHERVHRGTLSELVEEFEGEPPRGEACIVIEGLKKKKEHVNKYKK